MSSSKHIRIIMICAVLVAIIAISFFTGLSLYKQYPSSEVTVNSIPYVGIAFAGNTTEQAITQIDRARNYTNLFILDIGRNPLSRNQSAVYQICDYAVANELSVIINLGISDTHENDTTRWFWDQPMQDIRLNFTQRWGNKFLGIYDSDEPGGVQLDGDWERFFINFTQRLNRYHIPAMEHLNTIYQKTLAYKANGSNPDNYDLEANFFINDVLIDGDPGLRALNDANITTFTSDYGLYWFDYLGGYDVMFTELGWNASTAQQIALVKGAARLQDKDWGAMITWKYSEHSENGFLDAPENIYTQMLMAYQAGAKYIAIFDYSKDGNNTSYAMTDYYYNMLEIFWNDIHSKRFIDFSGPSSVLVLPANYGWGMRDHNDTIWGFWGTDAKTPIIANIMGNLVTKYGASLDIVYEDLNYPVAKGNYTRVYYWNQTSI